MPPRTGCDAGSNAVRGRTGAPEYGMCRRLNRGATRALPRLIFQIASRLGNGTLWYLVIFALPALYGAAAVRPAIVMAATGVMGLLLYSGLKRIFVRERPFITHAT